ncbi:UPF0561 protein C2orf68 homolog isoform X1 [Thamnophis elegans]|uniref:UPF0561 protein C2orf68 homolog isoform X1 n=1 Tax=Thamnophis elegans TaxID=35005 RepID=UPI001378CB51|nr:UPF0561 protein C2orf68 homolog isoform X1 [Thamnophis elegans]
MDAGRCHPGGRLDMSHGFVRHIRRNQIARDDYDRQVKQAKEQLRRRLTPAPPRPRRPDQQVYRAGRRGESSGGRRGGRGSPSPPGASLPCRRGRNSPGRRRRRRRGRVGGGEREQFQQPRAAPPRPGPLLPGVRGRRRPGHLGGGLPVLPSMAAWASYSSRLCKNGTMTPKKWWRRSVPRTSWSQLCTRPFGNEYKMNWRSGE